MAVPRLPPRRRRVQTTDLAHQRREVPQREQVLAQPKWPPLPAQPPAAPASWPALPARAQPPATLAMTL
eukprot:8259542-Lingulodinium_polyedra.AAC.1